MKTIDTPKTKAALRSRLWRAAHPGYDATWRAAHPTNNPWAKCRYRSTHREQIAAYERKWLATNPDKVAAYRRQYRAAHPEQRKASDAVKRAIAMGRMIRPGVCSVCNKTLPVEGHHLDYSKKLSVTWLCHMCHVRARRKS